MQVIYAQLGGNLIKQVLCRIDADGRKHFPSISLGMGNERH
jgi:hypothetical protein